MRKSCFIVDCSKYKEKNTSFHRFPTDPDLCKRWSHAIANLNITNNQPNSIHRSSHVCGHHFKDCDRHLMGKKTMLYKNAIPSIFPSDIDYNRDEEMEGHTKSSTSSSHLLQDACCFSTSSNSEDFIEKQSFNLASKHTIPVESTSSRYRFTKKSKISMEEAFMEKDPLAIENDLNNDLDSCTNSDGEDFLGFEAADLKYEMVNRNETSEGKYDVSISDTKEADDELIFVENTVEIIEIDDDDDDEIPPPPQPASQVRKKKVYSTFDIQQMVYSNDPKIELRKPQLNWKSDQFRLVYINGEKQNLCICTKCSELFSEINIDTIVRHAKCNPAPCVSPTSKRKKTMDQRNEESSSTQKSIDTLEKSVQNLSIAKIQAIAACIDVQSSTFFQGKRFLHFAQFLINSGASFASTNNDPIICEPKYDVLNSFRYQLKDIQLSKIRSILNTPDQDYSFSCDVWEDTFRKKTNISLELHYLDTSFLRHRIVIGLRSINELAVEDAKICEQTLDMLKVYSNHKNGIEFIQKATAFVTLGNRDIQSLGIMSSPSACSIINDIANGVVNEEKLKISEKCLQIIALLNLVSTEKITIFDARKWENVYNLLKDFNNKKRLIMQQEIKTIFPHEQFLVQLLEPFHAAIQDLSDSKNNITKVFGIYKMLESHLTPNSGDKEFLKMVKIKAKANLRIAFADSDMFQICMFLDPSNRDRYDSLESDKMDCLQSKIDAMINPYASTKENGCVDNDLIDYMDDSVTSQQNQIDLFLQLAPSKYDALEYWRNSEQMPGLKKLARKYFTIPTYATLSECLFSDYAKEFLAKRNHLEVKDLETMLMMNSSHLDADHTMS